MSQKLRGRTVVTAVGALGVTTLLALALAGRRDELAEALGAASLVVLLADASLLDATAVLIAMVTLSQLPIGPSVGAAAVVVILGSNGVALTAAAGVLLTATGTVGALCFAAWAGLDVLARFRTAGRERGAADPGRPLRSAPAPAGARG